MNLSYDPFDDEKDMVTSDGQLVEVKTQERLYMWNVFTVSRERLTNLRKCMDVDILVFVEYDKSDLVRIWRVQDRNHFMDFRLSDNHRMRGWYVNPDEDGPGLKLLREMRLPLIADYMRQLSTSANFKNYSSSRKIQLTHR